MLGLPLHQLLCAACVVTAGLLAAAVAQRWLCWPLFMAAFVVYSHVVHHGHTFLTFQWEILLLETGFIVPWMAPWLPGGRPPSPTRSAACHWLLRFAMFKLMFMSGVVKLTANCPTWTALTATVYHFATQPLPAGAAALARHMPLWLHRLSVAVTLWLEIPGAVLLMVPESSVATVAVLGQLALQVLIASTGNYTYFNWLTALLALNALPRQHARLPSALRWLCGGACTLFSVLSALHMFQWGWVQSTHGTPTLLMRVSPRWQGQALDALLDAWLLPLLAAAAAVTVLGVAVAAVRHAKQAASKPASTGLARAERVVRWACAVGVAVWLLMTVLPASLLTAASLHQPSAARLPAWVRERAAGPLRWRVASGYGLFRRMTGVGTPPATVQEGLARRERQVWAALEAHEATERRASLWRQWLTWEGVAELLDAPAQRLTDSMHAVSWAHPDTAARVVELPEPSAAEAAWLTGEGLPAPLPARPELQWQGQAGGTWQDVHLAFKPGNVSCPMPWVAPHQPRLDWQMWFAALGHYSHAPWAVHFAFKLLQGSPDVMQLVASPTLDPCAYGHWPFGWKARPASVETAAQQQVVPPDAGWSDVVSRWRSWALPPVEAVLPPTPQTPSLLRVQMFEYDLPRPELARVVQEWAGGEATPPFAQHSQPAASQNATWLRREVREWLPELHVSNPSLVRFASDVLGMPPPSREAAARRAAAEATCTGTTASTNEQSVLLTTPWTSAAMQALQWPGLHSQPQWWLVDLWLPLDGGSGWQADLLPFAPPLQVPVIAPVWGVWQTTGCSQGACFVAHGASPLLTLLSSWLCGVTAWWRALGRWHPEPFPPGPPQLPCETMACTLMHNLQAANWHLAAAVVHVQRLAVVGPLAAAAYLLATWKGGLQDAPRLADQARRV